MITGKAPWTNDEYHADATALSTSDVKIYRENPREFGLLLEGKLPRRETEEMRAGTILHARLFEPDKLLVDTSPKCQTPIKSGDRAGQPCGADCKRGDDRCGRHGGEEQPVPSGRILVSEDTIRQLDLAEEQIHKHEVANALLELATMREQAVVWECPHSGLRLKCKPDLAMWLSGVDLKYYAPTHLRRNIARTIRNRALHFQAAYYRRILIGSQLMSPDAAWRWIFAENDGPVPLVYVVRAAPRMLKLGEIQVIETLLEIAERMDRGDWDQDLKHETEVDFPEHEYREKHVN
jgi:hypothetical protein